MFSTMKKLSQPTIALFLIAFVCSSILAPVNAQDACQSECVRGIYAQNCGGASCITGVSSSEEFNALCGPACISAISGGSMLDCLTGIGGSTDVQNIFVLTVQDFCANGDPFKAPTQPAPAPTEDLSETESGPMTEEEEAAPATGPETTEEEPSVAPVTEEPAESESPDVEEPAVEPETTTPEESPAESPDMEEPETEPTEEPVEQPEEEPMEEPAEEPEEEPLEEPMEEPEEEPIEEPEMEPEEEPMEEPTEEPVAPPAPAPEPEAPGSEVEFDYDMDDLDNEILGMIEDFDDAATDGVRSGGEDEVADYGDESDV